MYILYPTFSWLFSERGGECVLTCVVGMMGEVDACMLELAEGLQPLVIQAVHHIQAASAWVHNKLTFQTIRHPLLEVPNCFISKLNIESIISRDSVTFMTQEVRGCEEAG